MASPTERFVEAVERDGELWQSIDVRLVAAFVDGAWRNLATHVYLQSTPPAETPRVAHPLRADTLRAEQHVMPIAALGALLGSITRGRWLDCTDEVTFVARPGPVTPYVFDWSQFHSLDSSYVRPHYKWSGHLVRANGEDIINRVPGGHQVLDNLARHHEHPFPSLDSLASYVLDVPVILGNQGAWCEIYAPYEVRIDPASLRLEEGAIQYSLVARSPAAIAKARLQVVPDPPSAEVPGETLLLAGSHWETDENKMLVHRGEMAVGASESAALVLRCGSQTVQWLQSRAYRVSGRSVPLIVYESIDPEVKVLKQRLSGISKRGDRAKQFEEAVGRLFFLGGWHVDVLRDGKMSDGVDIIAHHPVKRVCAAIECTTGALDASKIGKFVRRLSGFREMLPRIEVLGILATNSPHDALYPPQVKEATKSGLLVLHGGALLLLLELIMRGAGPSAVLDCLRQEGVWRPPVFKG